MLLKFGLWTWQNEANLFAAVTVPVVTYLMCVFIAVYFIFYAHAVLTMYVLLLWSWTTSAYDNSYSYRSCLGAGITQSV
jgi:hypothetical protein